MDREMGFGFGIGVGFVICAVVATLMAMTYHEGQRLGEIEGLEQCNEQVSI